MTTDFFLFGQFKERITRYGTGKGHIELGGILGDNYGKNNV